MKFEVFHRDANPAVDRPLHNVDRPQLTHLLGIGRIRMIGKRRAQYTTEQRDQIKIAKAAKPAFLNCANIESNTQWRIVGQTSPGDFGPGMPAYQLVP
jgi:hypothetical protein